MMIGENRQRPGAPPLIATHLDLSSMRRVLVSLHVPTAANLGPLLSDVATILWGPPRGRRVLCRACAEC